MKVLYLLHRWPNSNETAAGKRSLGLIRFFQERYQAEVKVCCPADINEVGTELYQLKVSLNAVQPNSDDLKFVLADFSPDVVLYDRFMMEEQFSWKVIELFPNVLQILDTQDLHFLRKARQSAFKNGTKVEDEFYSDIAIRELASILRVDLSLIISQVELTLLKNQFSIPEEVLQFLPLLAECESESVSFEERKDFFFIGNGLHEPNVDAVLHLKKEIWPTIRKALPETELHIIGAYLPEKIKQLHNPKEGFLILGQEANLATIFQKYRLLLAPLRFGAGQKGKLLDALEFGVPSVTTEIGIEGMCEDKNAWAGEVVESTEEFCEQAILLYENQVKWNEAKAKAKFIFVESFSKEKNLSNLEKRLNDLLQNLKEHRRKHFLSSILNHSSVQSYKYLSKWIQLKNEK